jgi:hypothetical protein
MPKSENADRAYSVAAVPVATFATSMRAFDRARFLGPVLLVSGTLACYLLIKFVVLPLQEKVMDDDPKLIALVLDFASRACIGVTLLATSIIAFGIGIGLTANWTWTSFVLIGDRLECTEHIAFLWWNRVVYLADMEQVLAVSIHEVLAAQNLWWLQWGLPNAFVLVVQTAARPPQAIAIGYGHATLDRICAPLKEVQINQSLLKAKLETNVNPLQKGEPVTAVAIEQEVVSDVPTQVASESAIPFPSRLVRRIDENELTIEMPRDQMEVLSYVAMLVIWFAGSFLAWFRLDIGGAFDMFAVLMTVGLQLSLGGTIVVYERRKDPFRLTVPKDELVVQQIVGGIAKNNCWTRKAIRGVAFWRDQEGWGHRCLQVSFRDPATQPANLFSTLSDLEIKWICWQVNTTLNKGC